MSNAETFHIDTGYSYVRAKGQRISGDVCLMRRKNNRTALVLADGTGTGIRANVIAETIASMCLSYTLAGYPSDKMAAAVLAAFPPAADGQPYACFTAVAFDGRRASVTVFGNPEVLIYHNDSLVDLRNEWADHGPGVRHGNFIPSTGDRIVLYTDGVTDSGMHTRRLPEGWTASGLSLYVQDIVRNSPEISSVELSRKITGQAEINDLFSPRSDMTAAVIYFRTPRRLMVCTGPPFNENKDRILADMVDRFPGRKVICGGTTAKIVARELGREITVDLRRDPSGLPPASVLDGMDMVTEGVLTLGRVKSLLEEADGSTLGEKGIAARLAGAMLNSDIIDFVVGTRVNPMHQDPTLPVELELRRSIVRQIEQVLRHKYLKEVNINYM